MFLGPSCLAKEPKQEDDAVWFYKRAERQCDLTGGRSELSLRDPGCGIAGATEGNLQECSLVPLQDREPRPAFQGRAGRGAGVYSGGGGPP